MIKRERVGGEGNNFVGQGRLYFWLVACCISSGLKIIQDGYCEFYCNVCESNIFHLYNCLMIKELNVSFSSLCVCLNHLSLIVYCYDFRWLIPKTDWRGCRHLRRNAHQDSLENNPGHIAWSLSLAYSAS